MFSSWRFICSRWSLRIVRDGGTNSKAPAGMGIRIGRGLDLPQVLDAMDVFKAVAEEGGEVGQAVGEYEHEGYRVVRSP